MNTAAYVGDTWRFSQSEVTADDGVVSVLITDTTPGVTALVSVILDNQPWGGTFVPVYDAANRRWTFDVELPGPGKVVIKWDFTYGVFTKSFFQSIKTQDRLPNVVVPGQSAVSWDIGPTGPTGMTGPLDDSRYLRLDTANGPLTGNVILVKDDATVELNSPSGTPLFRYWQTGTGGWNVMSFVGDFYFQALNAAGAFLGNWLQINRTTGLVTIGNLAGGGIRALRADNLGGVTAVPLPVQIAQVLNAGSAWTNMPLAETVFYSGLLVFLNQIYSLAGYTEFRLVALVSVVGTAAAKLRVKDVTDNVDLASVAGAADISIAATGMVVGPWTTIRTASKVDNHLFNVYGVGGDGVADPNILTVSVQVR